MKITQEEIDFKKEAPVLYALRQDIKNDTVEHTKEAIINHKEKLDQFSSRDFRNPLMYAFANGRLDLAEMLLENGANPNMKGRKGETPVCFATYYPKHESAEEAIEKTRQAEALLKKYNADFSIVSMGNPMSKIFNAITQNSKKTVPKI